MGVYAVIIDSRSALYRYWILEAWSV